MLNRIKLYESRFRTCSLDLPPVVEVRQGLSMSPSDISRAVSRGLAVSSQLDESLFYDGDDSPCIDVPLERTRGVDAVSAWEASQEAKRRLIRAHKSDVEIYGD